MNALESYHSKGSSSTSLCSHLIHPLLAGASKEQTKELKGGQKEACGSGFKLARGPLERVKGGIQVWFEQGNCKVVYAYVAS